MKVRDLLASLRGTPQSSARDSKRAAHQDGTAAVRASGVHTQHDPPVPAEVSELFRRIGAEQLRPVRQLLAELERGTATPRWLEIGRPALQGLIEAAVNVETPTHVQALIDLDHAMARAQECGGAVIESETRQRILACHDEVRRVFAEMFDLATGDERRDSLVLHGLLQQLPGVGLVTFEKLYGAGLTRPAVLARATPQELADATGIGLATCGAILDRVREHRDRMEARARDDLAEGIRRDLHALLDDLERRQDSGSAAAGSSAERARLERSERRRGELQLEVELAELGEIALIEEVTRLPLSSRVDRVRSWLELVSPRALGPHSAPGRPDSTR